MTTRSCEASGVANDLDGNQFVFSRGMRRFKLCGGLKKQARERRRFCNMERQRQIYIAELRNDDTLAKIIATVVVAAMLASGTMYFAFGSPLSQPNLQHTDQ
jgi:hypothetical protein